MQNKKADKQQNNKRDKKKLKTMSLAEDSAPVDPSAETVAAPFEFASMVVRKSNGDRKLKGHQDSSNMPGDEVLEKKQHMTEVVIDDGDTEQPEYMTFPDLLLHLRVSTDFVTQYENRLQKAQREGSHPVGGGNRFADFQQAWAPENAETNSRDYFEKRILQYSPDVPGDPEPYCGDLTDMQLIGYGECESDEENNTSKIAANETEEKGTSADTTAFLCCWHCSYPAGTHVPKWEPADPTTYLTSSAETKKEEEEPNSRKVKHKRDAKPMQQEKEKEEELKTINLSLGELANARSALETVSASENALRDTRTVSLSSGAAFGLPVRRVGGVLQTIGVFCSPECALAFALDSGYRFGDVSKMQAWLHELYREPKVGVAAISPAPPRESLERFGGPLTRTEFSTAPDNNALTRRVVYRPMVSVCGFKDEARLEFKLSRASFPEHANRFDARREQRKLRLARSKPSEGEHAMFKFIKKTHA